VITIGPERITTSLGFACAPPVCTPGRSAPEGNTFIRVLWPLFATDLVADTIAERQSRIGRVCISQMQDHRANADLLDIAHRVPTRSDVPISALVSATLMDKASLGQIQAVGVDIIGIGLDAASETLFYHSRGRGVKRPHDWHHL
jgi:biotin synthase